MDNAFKSFQRKIRNRQFAIENSWRTKPGKPEVGDESAKAAAERRQWSILNENLAEANAYKSFDGYLPLYSHRKVIGPAVVFVKKAVRKLIKIFLGWYVFPIYQRQSHFNGKVVNSISVERDILHRVEAKLAEMEAANGRLTEQVAQAQEANQRLESEIATLHRANEWLYSLVLEEQNANQTAALAVEELRKEQERGLALYETSRTAAEKKWQESALALDSVKKEGAAGLSAVRQETAEKLEAVRREAAAELADVRQEAAEKLEAVRQETAEEAKTAWQETAAELAAVAARAAAVQDCLDKIENTALDDTFYHRFEEKFRGSREEIVQRLEGYVPVVQEHISDFSAASFVDLGSGRGEWMDVLRQHGADNYVGVDLNQRQNDAAAEHGHKTVTCDCLEYLRNLPDESVDLITAFQLIEHLYLSDLENLFAECSRVLRKNGLILFETPNPRNLIVAANTFYLDPSHKRPLDPRMVTFYAEQSGFTDVQCIDSNAHHLSHSFPLPEEDSPQYEHIRQLNDIKWLLFGPQDYAVIAVKE